MTVAPRFILALAPLVLVAIASAVVVLNGAPTAPAGPPVGAERATPSSLPEAVLRLPETREAIVATPQPRPLDVTGMRILVPRLAIDLPLEIGDTDRDVPRPGYPGGTPTEIALVYPGSANPGGPGNTYVYAHARSGMFLMLWNAKLGDAVVIERADGTVLRSYQVALIVPRVDPSDTHWLDAQGVERITLQTSTGPRPEDPRFIVVAYPVAGPAEAPRLP